MAKKRPSFLPKDKPPHVRSREISITMPLSISKSLDHFLKYGCTDTTFVHGDGVDIDKATLIRLLLSAYGYEQSDLAYMINSRIWHDDQKNDYVSVRTANQSIIEQPANRVYRLVCAMVFIDMPIFKYDSKTGKRTGVYFSMKSKLAYARSHGGY